MFTNTKIIFYKNEELELLRRHEEEFDFVGISETWFDSSHDWLATVQWYSWRDRVDKRRGGVCLYVKRYLLVYKG